ncbi:ABC transporter substrate-binding protein [Alteromonadaceae bacterium M269]|nr:ABC transporter substrate-binding protein [Alteromonadaceae bacterium M269]
MKKILLAVILLSTSFWSLAQTTTTPTQAAEVAITKIIAIAADKELPGDERKEKLQGLMKEYVDLQAVAQRVLAVHWRKASKEEKIKFIGLFRQVLTNTYAGLLDEYTNEEVRFIGEEIKKEKFAEVKSIVISGGKEIPVNYLMLNRKGTWKLYDFVAEGISLVRTYSTEYKSILRSKGVSGLNEELEKKLTEVAE